MGVLESVKERMEKVTGWKRPSRGDLRHAVRSRKPNSFHFQDDGIVPNNPKLPFILYRSPVSLADDFDPAAVFEELFARNGWRDSWRNGIYDYVHYHSRTHEVLGVASRPCQGSLRRRTRKSASPQGRRCGGPAGWNRAPATGRQQGLAGGRRIPALRQLRRMPRLRGRPRSCPHDDPQGRASTQGPGVRT